MPVLLRAPPMIESRGAHLFVTRRWKHCGCWVLWVATRRWVVLVGVVV